MNLPFSLTGAGQKTAVSRRANAVAWVVVLVFVLVVGAATMTSQGRQPGRPTTPVVADIIIDGMHYSPDHVEVDPVTPVVLRITNNDDRRHDLKIGSAHSGPIDPGKAVIYDFGTFADSTQGWCTIAGHKAQGMLFDVTVTTSGQLPQQ